MLTDRSLAVGMAILVVASMLLVGAVHVPVILGLSLLSLPLGVAAVMRLHAEGDLGLRNPFWILLGLALFTALQAVPLPDSLLAWLAPQTRAVWADSLRPLGEAGPRFHSLSIDTGATWIEASKWLAYAAVFAAAMVLAQSARSVLAVSTLFGSALLAGLISAGHLAVSATRLYGVYEPLYAVTPWGVAPLLNPNNLSGYLLLGTFAGFALALERRPPLPRPILLVAIAGVLAVLILTGSRGGVGAFAAGLVVLAGLLLLPVTARRFKLSSGLRLKIAVGLLAVGVGGIGFASLAGSEATLVALQDESFSKISVVRWASGLVADNWVLGVGRGAFETAFPPYRAGFGRLMFQYPENFLVQWFSEWGAVVSLLAFGGLLWSVRPWRLLASGPRFLALTVGVAALLLQNLVDLGLEVMSVGIAFSVALGTLVGSTRTGEGQATPLLLEPNAAGRRWARLGLVGVVVLALAINAMGWMRGRPTAATDRDVLRQAIDLPSGDVAAPAGFGAQLRAAILRHPGDAYLPLLGAIAANRAKRDPIAWINRALERDPERGATHFLLAQVLLGHRSIKQGMLALRFAVLRQPEFLGRAAALALEQAAKPEDTWQAVPDGKAGVPMLLALALVSERQHLEPALSSAFITEATRRDPSSQPARLAQSRRLLRDLKANGAACSGELRAGCLLELDAALRVLGKAGSESAETILAGAKRLALDGKWADAARYLAERCPRVPSPAHCLQERVIYAIESKQHQPSKDAITAYLAAACDSADDCAKAATWIGDRLEERGDWTGAVEYYSQAAKERPSRAAWRKLSMAAKAAGQEQRFREADRRARQALEDGPSGSHD